MNFSAFFKDKALQNHLESFGFVKVSGVISAQNLTRLTNIHKEYIRNTSNGISSNVFTCGFKTNQLIDGAIKTGLQPFFKNQLSSVKYAGGVFLTKGKGDESKCSLHQDWNNVDEGRFASMAIWCPLIDVDQTNGALQVVPESHRQFQTIRSVDFLSVYVDSEKLNHKPLSIPCKAGDAICYLHNTFHGSSKNYTGHIRPAIIAGVNPLDAEHIHYLRSSNGTPVSYRIDYQDFHLNALRGFNPSRGIALSDKTLTSLECSFETPSEQTVIKALDKLLANHL